MTALTATFGEIVRRAAASSRTAVHVDLVVAFLLLVLLVEWDLVRVGGRGRLRPFGAPAVALLFTFAIAIVFRWRELR